MLYTCFMTHKSTHLYNNCYQSSRECENYVRSFSSNGSSPSAAAVLNALRSPVGSFLASLITCTKTCPNQKNACIYDVVTQMLHMQNGLLSVFYALKNHMNIVDQEEQNKLAPLWFRGHSPTNGQPEFTYYRRIPVIAQLKLT